MNKYYTDQNSNPLLNAVDLNEDVLSRYESLLSSFDCCLEEEKEAVQQKYVSREDKVRALADAYGKFLGIDFKTPKGQQWYNSTVSLYSKNDSLSEALRRVVECAGVLPCSSAA